MTPDDTPQEDVKEIINKALNAAVDAVGSVRNPCQAVSTPAFLRIRNDTINAINRTRP